MNSRNGRRVFIGSVAAGVPLLAGGGMAALAGTRAALDEHPHTGGGDDPVFELVLAQLGRATQATAAHGGPMRVDEAATAAVCLRLFAVRARSLDVNALAQQAVRTQIDRAGREAVIAGDLDREHVTQGAARYGIVLPNRAFDALPSVDDAMRMATLDLVLAGHALDILDRTAARLEALLAHLDHRMPELQRVQYADGDYDWYLGFCRQLQWEMFTVTAMVAMTCKGFELPALAAACAAFTGSLAVLTVAWFMNCSNFRALPY